MIDNPSGKEELESAIAAYGARIKETQNTFEQVQTGIKQTAEELAQLKMQAMEIKDSVVSTISAATTELGVLTNLRASGEVALTVIEESSRNAKSESNFARDAKNNAEEHAKAIAQIRGTIESAFGSLTTTKSSTEEQAQAIATLRGNAEVELKTIADAKTTSVRDVALVTAAAERVAAVMPSIDQGSKDANAITAAKDSAEANSVALQGLQSQMSEATAKALSDAASIAKADEDSRKLVTSMADARTKANEANARLNDYEQEIKRLTVAYSEMQQKLEGLLPHATSVGLASAFHIQKARFSKPQPYWLGLFVAAIIFLLLAASIGILATADNWDSILRHFANRLPLVVPLAWLAIYAGHHYNMALKMEEDYAYKEAVSTAFEGYKREMLSIPTGGENTVSPLVTLCENVLQSLAERPGRIYEGKTEIVTPLTPVLVAMKDSLTALTKGKETKP